MVTRDRIRAHRVAICLALVALCAGLPAIVAYGQQGLGGFGGVVTRAVGGVSIDANGVLSNAQVADVHKLHDLRAKALVAVPGDLKAPQELRKVSLRGLMTAIEECKKENRALPDEVNFLAGLQRIRYVFVYPEQADIVLAGYGEGWKIAPDGSVVGSSNGQPVLLLDDLLVALRSAMQAAQGGITCSIDPTPEGLVRYQQLMKNQATIGDDPQATLRGMEQALGPQVISITGVPDTSHFARVLVSADYRMKRLAMNFEPAPINGLPSYLQMAGAGRGMRSAMPRWWLATNYEPLLTDQEGLSWELRGPGVKAMTEEDFLTANGQRVHSGKASPVAQKWADRMTAKYPELAAADPIFGELRNCMDLAIISALLFKEHLPEKANCNLQTLLNPNGPSVLSLDAPKQVDSQSSFVQKGDNWIISTSGGVLIHSWGVADRKETTDRLTSIRDQAAPTDSAAWWRN